MIIMSKFRHPIGHQKDLYVLVIKDQVFNTKRVPRRLYPSLILIIMFFSLLLTRKWDLSEYVYFIIHRKETGH